MNEDWEIKVTVRYRSRAAAIESFEQIVNQMKSNDYRKCSAGNIASQYTISGPVAQPLTEQEIIKLRALI